VDTGIQDIKSLLGINMEKEEDYYLREKNGEVMAETPEGEREDKNICSSGKCLFSHPRRNKIPTRRKKYLKRI